MTSVSIPLAVLDAPEFNGLQWGDQKFLIALYIVNSDVERFTIDLSRPEMYRQSAGSWLVNRIHRLMKAGLLIKTGQQRTSKYGHVRVFAFKHSAYPEPADNCIVAPQDLSANY